MHCTQTERDARDRVPIRTTTSDDTPPIFSLWNNYIEPHNALFERQGVSALLRQIINLLERHGDCPKEMSGKQGNIEVLLVLSCLVGVVIFFTFALGITSIISQDPAFSGKPDPDRLLKEETLLQREKEKERERLKRVEEELKRLQREIAEKEKGLPLDGKQSERERKRLEKELQGLREEYEYILKRIERVQDELAGLSISSRSTATREEKEKELKRLKARLKELEEEIKRIKTEYVWKGTERFDNPLFVECRERAIVFYPEKKAVSISELETKNPFQSVSYRHDAIIILVRPDGFDCFEKSYSKAIDTGLKLSHEPVGYDVSLNFLTKR